MNPFLFTWMCFGIQTLYFIDVFKNPHTHIELMLLQNKK